MIEHSVTAYDITRTKSGDVSVVLTNDDGERVFLRVGEELATAMSRSLDYYSRPEDDALLNMPAAAEHCGVSDRSLFSRIRHNTMPAPDVEIPNPLRQGVLRYWWRSTLDRSGAVGSRRPGGEVGEGDIAGLFWAIVLISALAKGCGVA